MKIMVGGTFDPLHDGHKRLISRSFELAGPQGHVSIGLTTDQFAQMKNHPVRSYREREEHLVSFINSQHFRARWSIETLSDRFGSAIDADFDALVVSEETLPAAAEINRMRHLRGRRKVDIHQISCVLAKDGRWISSTRIYRGEIDDHGNIMVK
jgi:pantetheine-phosphate adenylyltransferase